MSESLITILGAVFGVAALVVLVAVVIFAWKIMSKQQVTTAGGLAKAAEARGWQFEHHSEIGKIHRKWSATTEGVAWTATHTGIGNEDAGSHRRHNFRWRAAITDGPAAPLVLIHERSSLDGIDEKTKVLPSFMRGLASAAIDHVPSLYFGAEAADIDLSSWSAVEGHGIAGMRVLAPRADASALVFCERIAPAIVRESDALAAGGRPPVILIRRDALHLASTSDTGDADLERAVRLGVGISRAVSQH
jgi:hypothetical protein